MPVWSIVLGILITVITALPTWADVDANYYEMDDNALLHFEQGQMWMDVRQYAAAIREFQIGIKLKPSATMSATLYNNMGLAYTNLHLYPKAIVSYQQAIDLNPNFSLYYENLAKVYQESGAYSEAVRKLDQAVTADPDNLQAWYLLAVLRLKGQQWEKARDALENYLRLSPDSELALAVQQHLEELSTTHPELFPIK